MAMVNPGVMNLAAANVKDSRWLTLEVCREFQRNKCTRSDQECKFAHPPPHVEVQNGRVTACFDSIKGKCQRKEPPCKYLHPPQHLREQLLQNGRNNLIIRNLQMQALNQHAALNQPVIPGLVPVSSNIAYSGTVPSYPRTRPEAGSNKTAVAYPTTQVLPTAGQYPHMLAHPYLSGAPTPTSAVAYNPYMNGVPTIAIPGAQTNGESPSMIHQHPAGCIPTPLQSSTTATKVTRPDRLEVCREFQRSTCSREPSECRYAHPPDNVTVDTAENCVTVCMDYIKGKCTRDTCRYFHPPPHLQAQIKACQQRANAAAAAQAQALSQIPGMVGQYKRVAVADAKGVPMYQPISNMAPFQQAIAAMQLQQPQYIPVSLPMVVPPEMATTLGPAPAPPGSMVPNNAHSVNYFDSNKQLLDSLPVCKDFKLGGCQRPQCKYIHVFDDYVEVNDGRVTVCRDAVRGKCSRPTCKYYHIPVQLPPSE